MRDHRVAPNFFPSSALSVLSILKAVTALIFVAAFLRAQGPPPSIVEEGVPPVPAELRTSLEPYLNARSAVFADWHPTEPSMLILTRFGETNQVHFVRGPGAYRQQLTFFRDRVGSAKFSPRPEKRYLVLSMDTGGSEFFQLYRLDLSEGASPVPLRYGASRLLTDGRSRNEGFLFNHRGTLAAYLSTRRDGRDFDLYTIDPESPDSDKRVLEIQGLWMPVAWSPDDRCLLLNQEVSINESYLHLFDLASGQTELLTPRGAEKASYGPLVWAQDGRGIYVVSNRGSEFRRLFYYDLGAKTFTPLTDQIPWDIEHVDLSSDGGVLAFSANVDGASQLHLLNTPSKQELPAPQLPSGVISNLKFHPHGNLLALTLNTARSLGDVYTFSIDSRFDFRSPPRARVEGQKLERWTFSETGGLAPESFPEVHLIHYPTFDQVGGPTPAEGLRPAGGPARRSLGAGGPARRSLGAGGKPRELAAFVARPPARFKPPYPVLIEIHGGPEGQTRPGFLGRYAYFVNEMGIALLEPNVRGSTGYGKTFADLDNGTLRENSVRDIGTLLDWIGKQPALDARRVAVMGGSYGGYMSLATMTHYSDRLRCGIDIVGVSNFVNLLERTQAYRRDLRRVEYGDERDPRMREFLLSISPTNHADQIHVPVLVAAGQNDPRVPASLSQEIREKIHAGGQTVWFILAKDEGHGYVKKPNVDYLQQAIALFLEQFLLR